LVVGGQSLCLLLTLLAVPVFYSLFDDLSRSRIWTRISTPIGGMFGRARRRVATAAASLMGSMFKILLMTACILLSISHSTRAQSPTVSPTPSVAAPQSLQV